MLDPTRGVNQTVLRTGETFAGYVIKRVLGQGGMGTVYLAQHPRLPRLTALKLLERDLYGDAEMRGRFEREADLVAQLDHPNIVTVYDRGAEEDQLWISMQFVAGSDAASVDVNVLAPARAVQIIGETGAALDFAHANGVLHRDVKPANILLAKAPIGQPERVLLTDFGIAGMRDSDTTLGSAGTITATLAYAAPEQLSGQSLDHRADQYSLACTLFWMLTGTAPFNGTSPASVMNGHLYGQVPSLRPLRPGIPPALDAVLARAMAKRPDDRFASCTDFAAAARRAVTPVGQPGPVGMPPHPSARTGQAPVQGPRTGYPTGYAPNGTGYQATGTPYPNNSAGQAHPGTVRPPVPQGPAHPRPSAPRHPAQPPAAALPPTGVLPPGYVDPTRVGTPPRPPYPNPARPAPVSPNGPQPPHAPPGPQARPNGPGYRSSGTSHSVVPPHPRQPSGTSHSVVPPNPGAPPHGSPQSSGTAHSVAPPHGAPQSSGSSHGVVPPYPGTSAPVPPNPGAPPHGSPQSSGTSHGVVPPHGSPQASRNSHGAVSPYPGTSAPVPPHASASPHGSPQSSGTSHGVVPPYSGTSGPVPPQPASRAHSAPQSSGTSHSVVPHGSPQVSGASHGVVPGPPVDGSAQAGGGSPGVQGAPRARRSGGTAHGSPRPDVPSGGSESSSGRVDGGQGAAEDRSGSAAGQPDSGARETPNRKRPVRPITIALPDARGRRVRPPGATPGAGGPSEPRPPP